MKFAFGKLLPFLLLISVTAYGQNAPRQAKDTPTELEEIIPFGEKGFVMILLDNQERPSKLGLRMFSNAEELIAEKEIDLRGEGPLLNQFEGAFEWDGMLCVLTSLYYPGPKRNHLILRKYQLPDFAEGEAKLIDEAYTPEYNRIPFGFSKSKDNRFAMFYSWTYTLPEDPAKLTVKVLDKNLEEQWTQRYILPFLNQSLFIFDCAVNRQGQAFIYCENYSGKPGRYIDEEKIDYFILRADSDKKDLIKYDLNPNGRTMTGLKIKMDSTDAIYGAAFLQDEKKKTLLDGVYLFEIPPDGKTIERSTLGLNDEMYKEKYPYGEKEAAFNANRHRFSNFNMDYIFKEADGSLVLVGEFRRELPNMWDVMFNDILVMSVSPDLQRFNWIQRVPKRQNGVQGNWMAHSYKAFQKKDAYFFLYNDALENHKSEGAPKRLNEYNGERSAVVLMQVTAAGELYKIDLTEAARKRGVGVIRPGQVWEINDGKKVMIYGDQNPNNLISAAILFGFVWDPKLR